MTQPQNEVMVTLVKRRDPGVVIPSWPGPIYEWKEGGEWLYVSPTHVEKVLGVLGSTTGDLVEDVDGELSDLRVETRVVPLSEAEDIEIPADVVAYEESLNPKASVYEIVDSIGTPQESYETEPDVVEVQDIEIVESDTEVPKADIVYILEQEAPEELVAPNPEPDVFEIDGGL